MELFNDDLLKSLMDETLKLITEFFQKKAKVTTFPRPMVKDDYF